MTDSPDNVPAGWYPTEDGNQRYWDGVQWTEQVAPMAASGHPGTAVTPGQTGVATSDDRTMAMLAHLLAIVSGFIGPLIIYAVKKDESAFVRDQAGEALNFNLSLLIYSFVYTMVAFILTLVLIGLLLFLVMPLLWIGIVVLQIVAGMAANRGEVYRYPLTIRFVK